MAVSVLWRLTGDVLCCWCTDGSYGWLAKNGLLEIFGMKTGEQWAAQWFGCHSPDMKTVITAVCQFGDQRNATSLAVATAVTSQHVVDCFKIFLYDICSCSISKAVQLPFMVCFKWILIKPVFLFDMYLRVLSALSWKNAVFAGFVLMLPGIRFTRMKLPYMDSGVVE